ncbi:MAG TPA: M48 family metalloprotease [Actinomycetota bacterium]|jgi:Zn-dependent protease with chaperone function|nr:M48 family metalloprotease [Actinomycetota bacterium]
MANKFTRRRWRRPERMTLEHPPVVRRKDIGAPTPLALEPSLARRASRRRLEILLVSFFGLCALEGLLIGAASGRWVVFPVVAGIGVVYFLVAREFGDAWLRRALRARPGEPTRLHRLAAAEARSAGVPPPDVLVAPGAESNAISLSLRKRSIVLTSASEEMDELALEGMLAHEVIHLRDGDAAVASLFLVLSAGPELLFRRAGAGCALALPLLPVALALRLGRSFFIPADREHRADVAAAMLTRYPPGIVEALETSGGSPTGFRVADGLWFVPRTAARDDVQKRAGLVGEM